ncbi:Triacylglycerol lipase 2 [Vitis vinifera]|uniref:Triacylglycerol lipase 2 n=1 Tax=Vitis vinifera TaxID=29760 RepID=A0A438BQT2_VITVI|nr:Triacylglycerol lipase 2 [Vitis vinifera]
MLNISSGLTNLFVPFMSLHSEQSLIWSKHVGLCDRMMIPWFNHPIRDFCQLKILKFITLLMWNGLSAFCNEICIIEGEVKCSFQPRRGGFVQWMIAMKAINEIRCHAVLENSPIFYENYGVFLCVAKDFAGVILQHILKTESTVSWHHSAALRLLPLGGACFSKDFNFLIQWGLPTTYLGPPWGVPHKSCIMWDVLEERFGRRMAFGKKWFALERESWWWKIIQGKFGEMVGGGIFARKGSSSVWKGISIAICVNDVNRCSLCKKSEESVDLLYNDKVVMDVLLSKLWDEMGVSRDYEKFAPQMEGRYGLGWRGGRWYANRKFRREQMKLLGQIKPKRTPLQFLRRLRRQRAPETAPKTSPTLQKDAPSKILYKPANSSCWAMKYLGLVIEYWNSTINMIRFFTHLLADSGFDVWIANTRGTKYSRGHTSLDPGDSAFGIGHGMSWYHMTFLLASRYSDCFGCLFPESAVLLSPIAYSLYWLGLEGNIHVLDFLISTMSFEKVIFHNDLHCVVSAGQNCCLNSSSVDVFLEHEPQSTATKNTIHLSQMIREGTLAMYDYKDEDENMEHYGQPTPPVYNMTTIPNDLPLFLSHGGQDALSDVNDVQLLLESLKDHDGDKLVVQYREDYAHADYVMASNAKQAVYDPLMAFFKLQ